MGFIIEEQLYFGLDDSRDWYATDRAEVERFNSGADKYALGCFKLRKLPGPI